GALLARESSYAAVVQALLVIAGEAPLDPAAVPRVADRDENTDRDWFEQPAFGGEPLPGGARSGRSPGHGPFRGRCSSRSRCVGRETVTCCRSTSMGFSSASILISALRFCSSVA